jgi:hypothetical protein
VLSRALAMLLAVIQSSLDSAVLFVTGCIAPIAPWESICGKETSSNEAPHYATELSEPRTYSMAWRLIASSLPNPDNQYTSFPARNHVI